MLDKDKILEQVKTLLKDETTDADGTLKILIEDCISRVLGYCRITEYPPELEPLLPIMVHRAYVVGGYGADHGTVKAMSQGDRSVTFEGTDTAGNDWIMDFADRLEPFRRRRGRLPSEIV